MASYEQKKNKKWSVRFYQFGVLRRLSGFDSKKEAEFEYMRALQKGKSAKVEDKHLTVDALYDIYFNYSSTQMKESSLYTIRSFFKLYILPEFGHRKINKISIGDINDWKMELDQKKTKSGKPISFSYKANIFTIFKMFILWAIKNNYLENNGLANMQNFRNREIKQDMLFWTEAEFLQFISVVDSPVYKVFFLFLYLTGCRKGEALGLRWQEVNFNTGFVNIKSTYSRKTLTADSTYRITTPKNHYSARKVLMPEVLVKELKKYYDSQISKPDFNSDCFVFGTNHPLGETSITRIKNDYCKLAGVKQIRLHDFRHSHVSLLISKNQNILVIAQRIGHANPNITLKTYAHLFPDQQREVLSSININLDT